MTSHPRLAAIALMLTLPFQGPVSALAAGAGKASDSTSLAARLEALEARSGGRLGVAVLDAASGRLVEHRGGERFPLCSTFKVLLAGAVLARIDAGRETLDRRISYGPKDLVAYSPITSARVAEGGLTVEELCTAAVRESDNTAANLLLKAIGGPKALTAFVRAQGDTRTRLDRMEPELNMATPGDPRDTTTPSALVRTLKILLMGETLSVSARLKLEGWMAACTTGKARLRAGIPADWAVGDKTGTGMRGTTNDVAILRPPHRAPILVAVYFTGSKAPGADREAVLAEVGRLVAGAFGP